MKAYLIFFSLVLFSARVSAQQLQPLVFSGGKNFVGKNVIQVEYGLNFERQINSINKIDQQVSQYGLVKYGALKNLDLSFSYNFTREQTFVSDQMRRANGLSNVTAGFKTKIAPNYSLKSDVGFSKNELGKLLGSFQILGISEHSIDSFLAWENNLGLNWRNGEPQANLVYLSGLTFTVPYPLDIIFEFYGQYGELAWNNYANIGVGHYFNADLMLEAYVGYGNTLNQQSAFCSVNLYWRLVPSSYNEK
ncbi:hypothetical protein SAMN05661096_04091 [Marivirga sericea]|uniref:MetA-pathway of phenol degradation n=1 Tax=Marivirga sericea TaxID=1028 RepID=A0A1X7LJ34_9BACT|nr:hypothetical protein [Marivirga sericea]SMG53547.1 hypothetical protein SAMN05661096_04091 [Marivirga sericea]